jgi:hypothetical protein
MTAINDGGTSMCPTLPPPLTTHVTSHSGQNESGNPKQLVLFNQIKFKTFLLLILLR